MVIRRQQEGILGTLLECMLLRTEMNWHRLKGTQHLHFIHEEERNNWMHVGLMREEQQAGEGGTEKEGAVI